MSHMRDFSAPWSNKANWRGRPRADLEHGHLMLQCDSPLRPFAATQNQQQSGFIQCRTKADVRLGGPHARLVGQDTDARSDDSTFYATPVDQNFSCSATDSGAYNSALQICVDFGAREESEC